MHAYIHTRTYTHTHTHTHTRTYTPAYISILSPGDNLVGLDCGTPDCRYSVLDDKFTKNDAQLPRARVMGMLRPFSGDSYDERFKRAPQKLKPIMRQMNEVGSLSL